MLAMVQIFHSKCVFNYTVNLLFPLAIFLLQLAPS